MAHHLARQVVALEAEWQRLERSRGGSALAAAPAAAASVEAAPPSLRRRDMEGTAAAGVPGEGLAQRQVEPPRAPAAAAADRREQEPLLSAGEAAELMRGLEVGGGVTEAAAGAAVGVESKLTP